MATRVAENAFFEYGPEGLQIDKALEEKLKNLIQNPTEQQQISLRFAAVKQDTKPMDFKVNNSIQDPQLKCDTISVFGYHYSLRKNTPYQGKTMANEQRAFLPLQILFENNHNFGQLVDLFAQGIMLNEIHLLSQKDESGKVYDKQIFKKCNAMAMQFYGKYAIMYYGYTEQSDVTKKTDEDGDQKGQVVAEHKLTSQ